MLIVTAKVPNRKRMASVCCTLLLCCAALAAVFVTPTARQVSATAAPSTKGIKSNEDRVEYLASYGWQVSEQPTATEELALPEEFDSSYDQYLQLQSSQGFDLSSCAGKRIKRYSYEVKNYPTGESGVLANLLIHKNTVVGGEILSPRLDGFLHGLAMPQSSNQNGGEA